VVCGADECKVIVHLPTSTAFRGAVALLSSFNCHFQGTPRSLEDVPRWFDGLGGAARRVKPWFVGKPIVHEGIALMPSSFTALRPPKPAVSIAYLPHHIVL
jgi:hypothetical protein